jgi:hypothetical protein
MDGTIGKSFVFNYPQEFVTLPEYSAHRGHVVTVISLAEPGDEDTEPVESFRCTDGWNGVAFDSELVEP